MVGLNTEKGKTLERLVRDYRERKAQIRTDEGMSWEQKERAVKALGEEFDARRRELEEAT